MKEKLVQNRSEPVIVKKNCLSSVKIRIKVSIQKWPRSLAPFIEEIEEEKAYIRNERNDLLMEALYQQPQQP